MLVNSSSVLPDVAAREVATRRDLHRFPGLGIIEFRTVSFVTERPAKLGLDVKMDLDVMDAANRMGMSGKDAIERAYKDAEASGRRRVLPRLASGHTGVVTTLKVAHRVLRSPPPRGHECAVCPGERHSGLSAGAGGVRLRAPRRDARLCARRAHGNWGSLGSPSKGKDEDNFIVCGGRLSLG
jgi:hypothetical protein